MTKQKTLSSKALSVIWFGAAVSIAEILTGALIAPLGLWKGLGAITIGHLLGCAILVGAGVIGAQTRMPAIESTQLSFGRWGAPFFAVLNVIQLVGWTGVMIASGAGALGVIGKTLWGVTSTPLFAILIGILIGAWIFVGFDRMRHVGVGAGIGLFVISLMIGYIAFNGGAAPAIEGTLSFGSAVELSVIMPLSWLPLIADYTRMAETPARSALFSGLGYFVGSMIMYAIGLGAALFAGSSDIAEILMSAGLPVIALLMVLLSTVTTTYLDVYSAAVSFQVLKQVDDRLLSMIVCTMGVALAVFVPIGYYEAFLYWIGTAFAPLFAIVLVDYFVLKRRTRRVLDVRNAVIWCIGVIVYRVLMSVDAPIGSTLPTMAIVAGLTIAVSRLLPEKETLHD